MRHKPSSDPPSRWVSRRDSTFTCRSMAAPNSGEEALASYGEMHGEGAVTACGLRRSVAAFCDRNVSYLMC